MKSVVPGRWFFVVGGAALLRIKVLRLLSRYTLDINDVLDLSQFFLEAAQGPLEIETQIIRELFEEVETDECHELVWVFQKLEDGLDVRLFIFLIATGGGATLISKDMLLFLFD